VSVSRESDRVGRLALFFGLFVLFWLVLVNPPTRSFLPEVDASWQGALSYFAFQGLQFGKDTIFTYGPLGYITTDTYSGYLLTSRIGFDLALKGVFAMLMAGLAVRLRPVLRWWFFVNVVLLSVASPDAVYLFVIALSACLVIGSQLSPGLALGTGILFAFVSLTKFTFFLQCGASLLIVVVYALSKRKWRRASGLAMTYLVCLLLFWCLAKQQVSGFLPFLRGAYEVASGYTEAMAATGSWLAFWSGLGELLLGVSLLIGLACASKEKDRDLAILLVLGVALFLAWKESFVRADLWHIDNLFAFLLFVEPAAWAVFRPPAKHRALLLGMTLIALLSSYVLVFLIQPEFFAELLPRANDRVVLNRTTFFHPSDFRAQLENGLSQVKEQNALPIIKHLIGRDSVDVFGHEQAIAILNGLNYQPRPVFQGYSAYTPFLVARNRGFYLGPTAPKFVILKCETIDDRFAAEDDAGALEVILQNYGVFAGENEYLLLKRDVGSPRLAPHRLLREGTATWGDPLPLSAYPCPVWIEIEIDSTWLGKLREFLYKPAGITMTLETLDHETKHYRLIRPLARSGFMVNPALRNRADLLEMYMNPSKGNASSVTLNVADSARPLYGATYHYRIYAEGMN